MNFTDYGQIGDALMAGKRAESRIQTGPVANPQAISTSAPFNSSDYMLSASLQAKTSQPVFVWSVDKWGDTKYKVGD